MSYSLDNLLQDLVDLAETNPDVLVQIEGDYYLVRPGAELRQVKGDWFVVIPAVKPILGRWAGEEAPLASTVKNEEDPAC